MRSNDVYNNANVIPVLLTPTVELFLQLSLPEKWLLYIKKNFPDEAFVRCMKYSLYSHSNILCYVKQM